MKRLNPKERGGVNYYIHLEDTVVDFGDGHYEGSVGVVVDVWFKSEKFVEKDNLM